MTNRPSYAQLEALVEFLESNPGIAKGLLRTSQAKLEIKRKWTSLAISLNALGGACKDGQGWAKYWAEKKCALKKQCAQLSASMRCTGGGTPYNLHPLSALDNRLVAVMGGQEFATNNLTLSVNPFPDLGTESPLFDFSRDHADTHSTQISATSIISPATQTATQAPTEPLQSTIPRRRRHRSTVPRPLDADINHFTRIEERRVEAELVTAQAFAQLSQHIGNIATALTSIATTISEIARKMPDYS